MNLMNVIEKEFLSSSSSIEEQIRLCYGEISKLEKQFDNQTIYQEFEKKRKEIQKDISSIGHDIENVQDQFSTSELERELKQRLDVIDRNVAKLKDDAANIKQEAGLAKSSITTKELEIKEDEDSLNKDVPICSKCLRPFAGKDDGSVIRESIVQKQK
jgi:hypothetical protein